MSVLIKDMEMPTDCAMLLKIFPDGRVGVPVHLNWMGTMVVNDAEAVPVPPHGRLGDLDALKERVTKRLYASNHGSMAEAYFAALIDLIDTAPTIIPAEEEK